MSSDVGIPAARSLASALDDAARAIRVSHLAKQYQLGARARYRTLREALVESVNHLTPWIPWATTATPTLADAEARLGIWIRDYDTGANHVYALFDATDGRLVGGVGLHPRVGPGAIEVGYWIRLHAVGRGVRTFRPETVVIEWKTDG